MCWERLRCSPRAPSPSSWRRSGPTRAIRYALANGSTDPVAAAERWARAELPLRLRCFENWLTEHIRRRERDGGFLTEVRAAPYLPDGDAFLNIRELFGLLDEVRDLRATLDVPLNRGLALEGLFRRLAPQNGRHEDRI